MFMFRLYIYLYIFFYFIILLFFFVVEVSTTGVSESQPQPGTSKQPDHGNNKIHVSSKVKSKDAVTQTPARPLPGQTVSSPTKIKLRNRVKVLNRKCQRRLQAKEKLKTKLKANPTRKTRKEKIDKVKTMLKELLPEKSYQFVVTQIDSSCTRKKGYRWNLKEKEFALSLFHNSPSAYRLLSSIFKMPSMSTLYRTVSSMQIYPGFSEKVLETLRKKVEKIENKLCIVAFDEMAVKSSLTYNREMDSVEGCEDYGGEDKTNKIANHVLVFMVKGLCIKWKQAVGFFYTCGPVYGEKLSRLIVQCLDHLVNCGLIVKAIVCDQGTNNRKAMQLLGITSNQPFFLHNGIRIHHFYDPPHLLKNIRNNLKHTGFKQNDLIISWEYIKAFYSHDRKTPIRLAPKLTAKHVFLPAFTNMKVSLAAQVLSHSVSAGIMFFIKAHVMPDEAKTTADFIEKFDQLFNSFNSRTIKCTHKFREAISNNSNHVDFLQKTLDWLATIQSGSKSAQRLPCLLGWEMAIKSLLNLWEELRTHYGVDNLLTSRLNQDSVENLFSIIRSKGGHMDNPNPTQFRQLLRKCMIVQIMNKPLNSNCIQDDDTLLDLNTHESSRIYLDSQENRTTTNETSVVDNDTAPDVHQTVFQNNEDGELLRLAFCLSDSLTDKDKNVCTYIAGYLSKKLQEKETCPQCQLLLQGQIDSCPDKVFLTLKQYASVDKGLRVPSPILATVVAEMERVYRRSADVFFQKKVHRTIADRLMQHANSIISCNDTKCEFTSIVVNMYTKIRIHYTIKLKNREMDEQKRKNRKVLKLSHL